MRDDVMTSPFLPAGPATPTWYDIVDSPVGRILLTGDERALGGLYLLDAGERSADELSFHTRLDVLPVQLLPLAFDGQAGIEVGKGLPVVRTG